MDECYGSHSIYSQWLEPVSGSKGIPRRADTRQPGRISQYGWFARIAGQLLRSISTRDPFFQCAKMRRMQLLKKKSRIPALFLIGALAILSGCRTKQAETELTVTPNLVEPVITEQTTDNGTIHEIPTLENFVLGAIEFDAGEKRPKYMPGELVGYIVQPGDTLPALAARFNSSELEIRKANAFDRMTRPPSPAECRWRSIYYRSQWGSAFQILPDTLSFQTGQHR